MLWGENGGKVKGPAAARSQTHDTSGLSRQCSATEPRQLDDHQPSQSSISTALVVFLTNLRPFSDPWKGSRDRWVWLCMLGSLAIYLIITQCFHSQMFLWRNWFLSIDRLLHVWHQGGLKFLVLLQWSVALSSQIADVFFTVWVKKNVLPQLMHRLLHNFLPNLHYSAACIAAHNSLIVLRSCHPANPAKLMKFYNY